MGCLKYDQDYIPVLDCMAMNYMPYSKFSLMKIYARFQQLASVGDMLFLSTGQPVIQCRVLIWGKVLHYVSYPHPDDIGHFPGACGGHLALSSPHTICG